ncbi:MAG TPA: DUF2452 domain-containing protein [Gammaproteobacteria bacterium]|nr:DUF2452 domain-containing protein [Gammaproteobacteria bacterium]
MSGSDLKKDDDPRRHRGPAHSSPYPVSRLAGPVELVDVAREIERADEMIATRTNARLQGIARQIRALQEEARSVLEQTRQDQDLHRARCNFRRRPGHVYHLYRKPDGSPYFSMLSPEDWDGDPPDEYRDSYRLEADMSWTPVSEIGRAEANAEDLQRMLGFGGDD